MLLAIGRSGSGATQADGLSRIGSEYPDGPRRTLPAAIPDGDSVICAVLPPLAPAANTTSSDLRNVRQV
jgi:hypothetical protein